MLYCIALLCCLVTYHVHNILLHNVMFFVIGNYFCIYMYMQCRPINNVLGFSKETLVAVITNIEGRECLRRLNRMGRAEHPRASTSDDVECFFSMMRDSIGQSFTAKQVQYGFRKVTLEFMKRLDPDLPFFITPQATPATVRAPFLILPRYRTRENIRAGEYRGVNYLESFLVGVPLCQCKEALVCGHNFTTSHLNFLHLQMSL